MPSSLSLLSPHNLQGSPGEDAWAPVLMHQPHSSECLALGAALLRMGAAEAVHPLFLAGISGTMQPLADAISTQVGCLLCSHASHLCSPACEVWVCCGIWCAPVVAVRIPNPGAPLPLATLHR